ncbi:MAG: hypothetical protein AB7M12_11930 [Hyphomonadaceae bacterium]
MSFLELMGLPRSAARRAPRLPLIARPPADAPWRNIKQRRSVVLRAWPAHRDGAIATGLGAQRYYKSRHWIVERAPGEYVVLRNEAFARLYRRRGDGRYEARDDVVLRYFTLPEPARVRTASGARLARAGDWIVQNVLGDLQPMSQRDAMARYVEL